MKKYRRIEITAFRHRVTIVSGGASGDSAGAEVWLKNTDLSEIIEPDSAEGQRILMEAVRLLEEKLSQNRLR